MKTIAYRRRGRRPPDARRVQPERHREQGRQYRGRRRERRRHYRGRWPTTRPTEAAEPTTPRNEAEAIRDAGENARRRGPRRQQPLRPTLIRRLPKGAASRRPFSLADAWRRDSHGACATPSPSPCCSSFPPAPCPRRGCAPASSMPACREPMAACMAERMVDRLSLAQLRRIGDLPYARDERSVVRLPASRPGAARSGNLDGELGRGGGLRGARLRLDSRGGPVL